MANNETVPPDATYLPELMAEKDSIDPSFVHALRLITNEIDKIKNPKQAEEAPFEMEDIFDQKLSKMVRNIKLPAEEYPKVNFIGRIIGPGGATLKGIQEVTNTKIAVLGKGSVREKKRQEEIAAGNEEKLAHLKLPLHVRITSLGPIDQAYVNVGRAMGEIGKLIQLDDEEYGDGDMQRSNRLSTGRGGRGMGSPFQRGRGSGNNRGGPAASTQRGSARGGRGGTGRGIGRGGTSRGASRGSSRGGGSMGMKSQRMQAADPYSQMEEYGGGAYDYSEASYDAYTDYMDPGYEQQSYGDPAYGADPYGDGSYGGEGYDQYSYGEAFDSYGNGAVDATPVNTLSSQYGQSKPFRGKMRGSGRGRASAKPY